MPKKTLDPKDKKANPVGLRKAAKNKKWNHVASVGEFVGLPNKQETDKVTKKEKTSGKTRIKLGDAGEQLV